MALMSLLALVLVASGEPCPNHLFVIERSKNANIVVYDANRGPSGDFEAASPVAAYWLLNGENDKREELTKLERDRAYGVDVTPGDTPGTYVMAFKAARKRRLAVRMLNECPVTIAPIGGHDGILRKLFVQSKEGSFPPGVEYLELFGEDVATGEPLYEKFVPGR